MFTNYVSGRRGGELEIADIGWVGKGAQPNADIGLQSQEGGMAIAKTTDKMPKNN